VAVEGRGHQRDGLALVHLGLGLVEPRAELDEGIGVAVRDVQW